MINDPQIAELKALLRASPNMIGERLMQVSAERDRLKARVEELEAQAILQAVIWDKEVARLKADKAVIWGQLQESRAEVARLQKEREENKPALLSELEAMIAQLTRERDEAQKDTARLDWLEQNQKELKQYQ